MPQRRPAPTIAKPRPARVVTPDPQAIRPFVSEHALEAWLKRNHDRKTELWIKIFKKGSGKPSVDYAQALDVALCWGWIDGQRKALDEQAFLQRFTPRTAKSRWSEINRRHVQRLSEAGRMTEHGQRQIDAAKSDGRWQAAYPPSSSLTTPPDLLQAIAARPKALATFRTLNRHNLYALGYRLHHLKTPASRARRIAAFVALLERGETLHPNPPPRARAPRPAKRAKAK